MRRLNDFAKPPASGASRILNGAATGGRPREPNRGRTHGRTATLDTAKESATVELCNGDRLSGVADVAAFSLDTSFGPVTVDLALVRSLTVRCLAAGGEEGLTLWCTFDSAADVESTRVGAGGRHRSGTFVRGQVGQALGAGEVVNPTAGCIEFWAKLVDMPAALAWGQNPTLIRVCQSDAMSTRHRVTEALPARPTPTQNCGQPVATLRSHACFIPSTRAATGVRASCATGSPQNGGPTPCLQTAVRPVYRGALAF